VRAVVGDLFTPAGTSDVAEAEDMRSTMGARHVVRLTKANLNDVLSTRGT